MAFHQKTDHCGLTANDATKDSLVIRDDNENASSETYAPQGQDGAILGIEVFGDDSAPSNTYGIKANIDTDDGDIMLNSITEADGKKFALESLQVTTSAGAAPTLSATSQEIETDAEDENQCKFEVPALAVSTKWHAQKIFKANPFTLAGKGCSLAACSATIGCQIGKDKVAGLKIGSDAHSGLATLTGSILQNGNVQGNEAPTVEPTNGWMLTKRPSCANPEAAYKKWSFELQLPLRKIHPGDEESSASSSSSASSASSSSAPASTP